MGDSGLLIVSGKLVSGLKSVGRPPLNAGCRPLCTSIDRPTIDFPSIGLGPVEVWAKRGDRDGTIAPQSRSKFTESRQRNAATPSWETPSSAPCHLMKRGAGWSAKHGDQYLTAQRSHTSATPVSVLQRQRRLPLCRRNKVFGASSVRPNARVPHPLFAHCRRGKATSNA